MKSKELNKIITVVSRVTGVAVSEIKSRSQSANPTNARHIFCAIARKNVLISYEGIGKYIGGRCHNTIMKACQRVEAAELSEPVLFREYERCNRVYHLRYKRE